MRRLSSLLVLVVAVLVLGACASTQQAGQNAPAAGPGATIYWCDCGPECKCNSVSTAPGKCTCGKEMAGGHVVFMEGNTALVCTCGTACTCKIDPNDHAKCGCGKPVKRINLEGTGIYFCNCKGSCGCNVISGKPGACKCNMPLHQAK